MEMEKLSEQKQLHILKAPKLYRRLREHGVNSRHYLLNLPNDLLDLETDTLRGKRFPVQLGYDEEGKRYLVVALDSFIRAGQPIPRQDRLCRSVEE